MERTISAAEPVSQLRSIKIAENGEALVDFLIACPDLIFDAPRFNYRRATVVRKSVAEMLCRASAALPAGYRLAVVEGWRAPHIQRRMYLALWRRFEALHPDWSEVTLKRVVNRFTAPLHSRVPPPHTTGGAVDVMLANLSGGLCDHSSPYEAFEPRSFPFDAPDLSHGARETRNILSAAMRSGGLTNYPSEFWHWSYGDQGWAYRGGHAQAVYGPITPVGFHPDPAEDIDEPLELI